MGKKDKIAVVVLGGGCFWCTEAVFLRLRGVLSILPGYAGGTMENPSYEDVSTGKTGHAEVLKVEYDPATVSFWDLLTVFFATHDPTTLNRQGNDVGTQYRSAIFYTDAKQRDEAMDFVKKLADEETYEDPIVTEIQPLSKFWPAESYHQRYYELNQNKPYCQFVINPKITKLRSKFAPLLKPE